MTSGIMREEAWKMSENSMQDIERKLREARDDVGALRSALRKGRNATRIGSICLLAIVLFYVVLFYLPVRVIVKDIKSGDMPSVSMQELLSQSIFDRGVENVRAAISELTPEFQAK